MGKLFVEELLDAEVSETLGREKSERREGGGTRAGYRNGYKARRLRTGEGGIEVDVPQVRDFTADGQDQPYRSAIWQGLGRRSVSLDKLVAEMYARGLSTRDIEDLLKESSEDGQTILLSKSSVSQVTEVLWEQYEAFTKRDLSGFDVVYLFADAVFESLKQQACCTQAVLVSWAILRDGSKVLLHMSLGNKESQDSRLEHFRSLVSRGLPTPLTVTTDGAPGLIKAAEARRCGRRPSGSAAGCTRCVTCWTRSPTTSGRRSSGCCSTSATPPTTRRAPDARRRSSSSTAASCPAWWPASSRTWRRAWRT
jgi:transposase-like protein